MVKEEDLINCENETKGNKSAELVCRIARGLQERDVNVAFSEIEDGLRSIHQLGDQIKDMQDLRATLKSSLAKTENADRVFNAAFDKAIKDTFPSPKAKAPTKKEIEKELE
jgi:uncharacterized protein with von Willebrand factor type A (vWA) domain